MSDLFQKALAIFDLHWRKREKEILSHPKNEQWIIRQHIRNIGKKRAVESSKRNNSK